MSDENKSTIKSVLLAMKSAVEEHKTLSPNDWINWALELSSLWQDLKDEVTKFEIKYYQEICEKTEGGMKLAEAERQIKAKSDTYKMYRYLLGRDKIVEEFIKIAKKRAMIENEYS